MKNRIAYIVLVITLAGCKDPFTPHAILAKNHYLVVEGMINADGPTTIRLTRTRNITDTAAYHIGNHPPPIYELGARVNVEDDQGNTYSLPEVGDGQYGDLKLPLNDQRLYRLHIWTGGEEYVSDYVPVLHTPPIDSIRWTVDKLGVSINVSTHNDHDTVGYYRWTYRETWEFHVYYYSEYKYDTSSEQVVPRTDQIYRCWQSDSSTDILIGNTSGLKRDVISSHNLIAIPYHSEQISILYSVMVSQYALTKQEYNYWQSLKKNTQDIGSLFDPQPSNAPGNITCLTDPKEIVLGYVGSGDMVQKRLFIDNSSLPGDWNNTTPDCPLIKVIGNGIDSSWYYYGILGDVPVTAQEGSYRGCADCTTRGSNHQPSFWP
jgi:hypothetical protein